MVIQNNFNSIPIKILANLNVNEQFRDAINFVRFPSKCQPNKKKTSLIRINIVSFMYKQFKNTITTHLLHADLNKARLCIQTTPIKHRTREYQKIEINYRNTSPQSSISE